MADVQNVLSTVEGAVADARAFARRRSRSQSPGDIRFYGIKGDNVRNVCVLPPVVQGIGGEAYDPIRRIVEGGTRYQKALIRNNYKRFSTREAAEAYAAGPAASIFSRAHVEPFTKLVVGVGAAAAALSMAHYAVAAAATALGCSLHTQGVTYCNFFVEMVCCAVRT
eukprot:SAG11_NODE_3980_length_2123_cov_4.183794_1_plen_167_part_00